MILFQGTPGEVNRNTFIHTQKHLLGVPVAMPRAAGYLGDTLWKPGGHGELRRGVLELWFRMFVPSRPSLVDWRPLQLATRSY